MSLDVSLYVLRKKEVFEYNITHNLGKMAGEAGIYKHLWRPDEIGVEYACDLITPLKEGLDKLKENPEHYKTFNPENGWGNYGGLVAFVEEYLKACQENPDAEVSAWRTV